MRFQTRNSDAACAVCIALTRYGPDLQNIEAALLAAELDDHYGVLVDFIALLHENAQLAYAIVANPQPMLELLEDALLTAQVGSPALVAWSKQLARSTEGQCCEAKNRDLFGACLHPHVCGACYMLQLWCKRSGCTSITWGPTGMRQLPAAASLLITPSNAQQCAPAPALSCMHSYCEQRSLLRCCCCLQDTVMQQHPHKQTMAVKPNAHVRLQNLPYSMDPDPNPLNPSISSIGSAHLGKLVTITGTVLKAGPVKMFEAQKVFMCNKCKHRQVSTM
jgi:DNA replicative helicase MCM subunit Mcm2 (Cdc46/Mcm family)